MLNTALKDFTDRQPHRAISDTEFRDIAATRYNDFFLWLAESSVLDPVPRLWAEVTGPSALGQFDQMIDEIEALQDGPRTKEHLTYIEHKMRQAQEFWGEIIADCPVRKQVTVKNRRIFHLERPVDSGVLTRFRAKLADVLDGADIEFVFPQNPEKAQPSRNQGKISSLFPEEEEPETHKPPKSMLTESKEETVAPKTPWSEWLDQGEIEIVTDLEGFRAVVNEASKVGICGLDLETTGLDPLAAKIRLVQIGIPKYPGSKRLVDEAGKSPVPGGSAKAYVIDLFALSADERKEIVEILVALVGDPNVIKIGHNLSFDLGFIRASAGRRIPMRNLFDTMLASQLVWAGFFKMEPTTSKNSKYRFKEVYPKHRLSDCVDRHLNVKLDKTGQTSDWSAETLSHDQILYAAKDVLVLPILYEILFDLIRRNEMEEAARLEFDCLPSVVEMEITGMPLNLTATKALLDSLTRERDELEIKLIGMAESSGCEFKTIKDVRKGVPGRFNPASIPNVLEYFNHVGHSVTDTRDETLQDLARAGDEFARLLLGFREKTKRVAFLVSWLEKTGDDPNGYAHLRSSYRQLGDKGVGRFTSSDVNLQQIPRTKEYRELFEVPEGRCLVIADYSAIELRIMAWLSGDPTMVTAFQNRQDLHRLTAAAVGRKDIDQVSKDERQASKAINFGLIYGCGAQRLVDSAKYDYGVDMSLTEANRAKKAFFATYPKIEEWHQKQRSLMDSPVPHWFHHHNTGYYSAKLVSVTIPPGRKRVWPWFKGKTLARLTMLANSPDQGTGASILKRALIRVHDRLLEYGWDDVYLAANVHDEIILEGPMEKAETMKEMLEKEMVHAGAEFIDPVPVEVEGNIGTSWAEK